ncbi:cytochrome c-type biogenesis protein [Actinoalloteichus hoggarensis]|uniref:Thiol:disulfide interchange protein n=1 Tax=Actinoalloteichus hoggarensis TaxID=1470176 RepID=A0A221VX59_9PSEU|nr:cytochrome c biogenesis CcdA family protein [Actinoalloteichus hoggarensis]ASO18132.1 thiol:disulfide interchange protein precursor [Actinoalloteichus hoggarensis]MBB5921488.1 cytochrome c-type biogenesis protein [Actinoalloteichus hoggarensis]
MDPSEFVISGPLMLATGVAVLAGLVSFASPCVIPLVPGYLAYLAGLVGAEAPRTRPVPAGGIAAREESTTGSGGATAAGPDEAAAQRRSGRLRVAGAAGLFVLGFTAVFLASTVFLLGLTDLIFANQPLLQRIGGVVTIAMGLVFLGFVPALQRDVRVHRRLGTGVWGAPLLGGVFGLGWTPCLSPTLGGVIAVAATTDADGGMLTRGVVLVVAYCLGLGLPFVLLALGAGWAVRTGDWLRRNSRRIQIAGGVLLLAVGIMLVTGLWGVLISLIQGPIGSFELPL